MSEAQCNILWKNAKNEEFLCRYTKRAHYGKWLGLISEETDVPTLTSKPLLLIPVPRLGNERSRNHIGMIHGFVHAKKLPPNRYQCKDHGSNCARRRHHFPKLMHVIPSERDHGMKERPILFSAPMIRALLDGRKTQTRRILKPQPQAGTEEVLENHGNVFQPWSDTESRLLPDQNWRCPYGVPGDRLWVKEGIVRGYGNDMQMSRYSADGLPTVADAWPWQRNHLASIHCPRRLSRILLEVNGVRVERLQDISETDAAAEGVNGISSLIPTSRDAYRQLWKDLNGAGSWDSNPWIWVVSFKRINK